MNFIYSTGCTWFCMPGCHPLIRHASCTLNSLHYAKWLLLQLSIEADITMGCYY